MFGGTLLFPLALLSQAAIFLVPAVIRDTVYDFVADNRYSFLGKRDECRLDDDRYQDCFLPD
jgi:predicted DCC family thiol-disulfide oxidoreductase YuxK